MNNFDDLFRSELADHAVTPPSHVWDNLEQRLNANAAGGKTPAGKGWYWMVGVASVAVVVGALGWSMVGRDATPTAAPVAMAAATANTPVAETATTAPEQPETGNVRKGIAAHRSTTGNEQATENDADEVTAYGNAVATGTKLHSYDEFDERATAGSQKPAPLNSDEEHAANGYKVNKIRKHRLVAAEMVPVSQQHQQVYAAVTTETAKPAEVKNTAATRQPVRTIASKVAGNQGAKKAVVLVNETADARNAGNGDAVAETPNAPTGETMVSGAAERPAATSPLPVPAGSATAAKSKPASEIVLPAKPTTGGSEQARADSQGHKNADDASSETEKKKGLWGIFKKKK